MSTLKFGQDFIISLQLFVAKILDGSGIRDLVCVRSVRALSRTQVLAVLIALFSELRKRC